MCNRYKAPSKPEEEISIETIKKLPKMYFTNITGGEPFIRTDLKDIVRELYKKALFTKHPYSMYELKSCRDYRDGKVTKEELDKCSTCDMCAVINNGLSEASKEQLKTATGNLHLYRLSLH